MSQDCHQSNHQMELLMQRVERMERRVAAARRTTLLTIAGAAAGMALLWSPVVRSAPSQPKACSHSDLYCFAQGAAARAEEVNSNFEMVYDVVDTKFDRAGGTVSGAVNAASFTTGGAVASGSLSTGNVSASRVSLDGGVIQRGGATITTTSDLGLYSQLSGNYIRIVTNAAPVKFYSDSGTGTTDNFTVESNGRLSARFNETGSFALLPDSYCVIVPQSATCPSGWDAREVKWDTEDDNNADGGKDGKIAWDNGSSASVRMRHCCRGTGW